MRRIVVAFLACVLTSFLVASPVGATNAHFNRAAGTLNSDGSLTVSFKEVGLGTNLNINFVLTADSTVVYVCVNKGGSNPSAQNKTTVNGPVSASGTFASGKNGSISASLTVSPPSAGSFSCPGGQTLRVASVTYINVSLTDTTNNVSADIPGTFSSGCLLPRVRGACD